MANYNNVNQIKAVLADINYKNWWFIVEQKDEGFYLQVAFMGPDSDNPTRVEEQHGRKWLISRFMTKNELIQTAFKAILTAEEHEVRENFLYKGRRILGPHIDVDALWNACTQLDVRNEMHNTENEDDIEADWPEPEIFAISGTCHDLKRNRTSSANNDGPPMRKRKVIFTSQ